MKTNQLIKLSVVTVALFGVAFIGTEARAQNEAVFEQNANGQYLDTDSCGIDHYAPTNNLWTQSETFGSDCNNQSYLAAPSNWNIPNYPNGSNFDVMIGAISVHLNGSVAMGNLAINGLLNLDANNTGGVQDYSIDVVFNGGTIVNNGSIISIGPNDANQSYDFNVDTLLTGNGSITFGYDTIVNGPGVLTIDTNQNVIVGGRTILNAPLANHGTITSDGTSSFNGTYTVTFASPQITNTGTIRTMTSGGIVFQASTVIDNTGGTLSATGYTDSGGVFNLNAGVSITGGTLVSSGGPVNNFFDVSGGGASLNNLSIATGTEIFVEGSVLTLNGAITNGGLIICAYNQNPAGPGSFNVASDTTLSGTGRINVQYSSNNTIASGATLTLGPGQALDGGLCSVTGTLTNHGLVNANSTGNELILKGGNYVNNGTIQASGGGILTFGYFTNFTIDNTGGVIQALDNSVVQFAGVPVLVRNGTLTSAGNGYVTSATSGDAITLENVTNNGQLNLPHGCNVTVNLDIAGGSLTNNGHIDDTGFQCNPVRIRSLGDLTINGNGRIFFNNGSFIDSTGSGVITNGAGHTLVNGGGGSINASLVNNGTTAALESEGNATNLNGPTVTNNGMLEVYGNASTFNYEALLQQSGSSTLTNYDPAIQTLTGGTYSAIAARVAAVLSLNIGPIVVNNATVILSGPGAQFDPINSIHQNWGTLAILNGRIFFTAAPPSNPSKVSKPSNLVKLSKPIEVNRPAVSDSLANAGTVKLDQMSTINVNGNYTQGSNARLYIEIGADGPNPDFHQLNVSGTAALAGTLDVRLVNGYTPPPGQMFPIINATAITGGFTQVHGADVTSTATGISIHPNGAPIPLALTGAVSRKTHQAGGQVAGTFNLPLSLTGPPTVECRSGGPGGNHTLVFTFTNALTSVDSVSASATNPNGPQSIVVTGSSIGPDAHEYIVDLGGVPNAQYLTVTLNGAHDDFGQVNAAVAATMAVLIGDTNANGSVNSTDIAQTKAQIGAPVTNANFREDVTVNGTIDGSDVALVKSHLGSAVP